MAEYQSKPRELTSGRIHIVACEQVRRRNIRRLRIFTSSVQPVLHLVRHVHFPHRFQSHDCPLAGISDLGVLLGANSTLKSADPPRSCESMVTTSGNHRSLQMHLLPRLTKAIRSKPRLSSSVKMHFEKRTSSSLVDGWGTLTSLGR